MRKILPILLCLAVAPLHAQSLKSEDNTTTTVAELRVEANFTKHFSVHKQGINLYFGEAVFSRLSERTTTLSHIGSGDQLQPDTSYAPYFRRSYTTVGLNYTPIPYLRMGAEYTLKIYGNKFTTIQNGTTVSNPASEYLRHRATFYLTGYYTLGDWKFSLRERLDANIRTDSVNTHEKPKAELLLRHKLQAQYSIPGKPIKTYAYIELWNTLNQPVKYLNRYGVSEYLNDGTTANPYYGKTFGQYLSEVRTQLGVNWRIDKLNTLSLAYRFTYGYSRDIDITHNKGLIKLTNAESYGHYIVLTYDLDW